VESPPTALEVREAFSRDDTTGHVTRSICHTSIACEQIRFVLSKVFAGILLPRLSRYCNNASASMPLLGASTERERS